MTTDLMDPIEWLEQAKAVPVGQKEKVTHLCGDASLVVYNNIDSWTAWCWRCHTRGWVPKEQPNMKERLARKAQQEAIDRELSYQVRPPSPASFDLTSWSVAARVWLYKAGLTPDKIRDLGAYFHEPTQRVVLPVRDKDGKVVFWQARNPEYPKVAGAKYISASVPRDRIHVQYGGADGFPTSGNGQGVYCITEDILSAYKVGASGAAIGYAVMGTDLGQHSIARLLLSGSTSALLWFDPDDAGEAAANRIGRQLRLVGIEPLRIITPRDPKCYSFDEIRGHIGYGLRSHAAPDHAGAEEVLPTQADT